MKKLTVLLLTLALLATLCACGNRESVVFQNDLSTDIHGIYISPVSEEEWSDPLNYAVLKAGASITIDFQKFAGETPYYDVGTVDKNGMNYDVYDVPLAIGDKLALSAEGETVTLTVTGADGTVKSYDGYAYNADDLEQE